MLEKESFDLRLFANKYSDVNSTFESGQDQQFNTLVFLESITSLWSWDIPALLTGCECVGWMVDVERGVNWRSKSLLRRPPTLLNNAFGKVIAIKVQFWTMSEEEREFPSAFGHCFSSEYELRYHVSLNTDSICDIFYLDWAQISKQKSQFVLTNDGRTGLRRGAWGIWLICWKKGRYFLNPVVEQFRVFPR